MFFSFIIFSAYEVLFSVIKSKKSVTALKLGVPILFVDYREHDPRVLFCET